MPGGRQWLEHLLNLCIMGRITPAVRSHLRTIVPKTKIRMKCYFILLAILKLCVIFYNVFLLYVAKRNVKFADSLVKIIKPFINLKWIVQSLSSDWVRLSKVVAKYVLHTHGLPFWHPRTVEQRLCLTTVQKLYHSNLTEES